MRRWVTKIRTRDFYPETKFDLYVWQVVLVPGYLIYRVTRPLLPDDHPWKKVIHYPQWWLHSTSLNFELNLAMTLAIWGAIAALLLIWRQHH